MKVFIDTNVLVSAFTARGLCADLIEVILTDHILITGEFVLKELDRVLTTKLKVPEKDVLEILKFLNDFHVEPLPDKPSKVKIDDDDDRWVLESAVRANADILVTGDKDLLEIRSEVKQLNIITPREFWELAT